MNTKKYRIAAHSVSITNGPSISDLAHAWANKEIVKFTFEKGDIGLPCSCVLLLLGFQDAEGNIIKNLSPSEGIELAKVDENILVFGIITILPDDKNEADLRSFEYYNPDKRKGECLDRGEQWSLRKEKVKKK